MNNIVRRISGLTIVAFFLASCQNRISGNEEMIGLLSTVDKSEYSSANPFCEQARLIYFDSLYRTSSNYYDSAKSGFFEANTLLEKGDEQQAIALLENLLI